MRINGMGMKTLAYLAMLLSPVQVFAGSPITIADVLEKCKASYGNVQDYTCMLHRRDVVKGKLKEHTTVLFKFKRPSRFYMMWPKDKIEAIYAEGKYDNKMVIHGGLLFKFMSLAVKPEAALKYNRHTIKEADIGHIIDIIEANYRKAVGDRDASIVFEKDELLDARPTWRFKAVLPRDRNYYGHVIYLNIDKKMELPIKMSVYGWDDELLEEYYYEDLKLNVGLKEEDFDVNNAAYAFKVGY